MSRPPAIPVTRHARAAWKVAVPLLGLAVLGTSAASAQVPRCGEHVILPLLARSVDVLGFERLLDPSRPGPAESYTLGQWPLPIEEGPCHGPNCSRAPDRRPPAPAPVPPPSVERWMVLAIIAPPASAPEALLHVVDTPSFPNPSADGPLRPPRQAG